MEAHDMNLTDIQSQSAKRGEKTTTNIVGLDYDPEGRQNLIKACNEVLSSVRTKIPEGVAYRTNLERTLEWKLKVLELNPENGAAEEALGFQFEQEIAACKQELSLIPKMAGKTNMQCISLMLHQTLCLTLVL